MVSRRGSRLRPGFVTPAGLAAALLLAAPLPAFAQARPAAPAQAPAAQVPDQLVILKLVWSTMAAVDQANRTGNYSVLRDLGSAGFQANNNPAALAAAFASIRAQQIDLSNTLLVTPVWEIAPTTAGPGLVRMRGSFPLRPLSIGFDLIYQWDQGWRLHAIAVQPLQPAPARQ